MNPYLKRAAFFFLLYFLCGVSPASGAITGDGRPFQILYPEDRSLYGGGGAIHVVVEIHRHPGTLRVRVNGKVLEDPAVKDAFYHYAATLEFGLNRLDVELFQDSRLIGQEMRELFFFSPIAKIAEVPRGFILTPFHLRDSTPNKCARCHVLEPRPTDAAPPSPGASSCHICHRGLTQFKQVHGPAALWNCLRCHDPDSSPARYATAVPVRNLCYGCHTDQRDYFFSSPYQHGPTATGMCTICHNPHASDNEFWLKKEPWDLCTTCHAEKASGRHVIAWGPSGQTHPTRGRPDPKKPEREFSCRSCHNPHASNMPKLWNYNVSSYFDLCQVCHNK